jgi:hypothetical protein
LVSKDNVFYPDAGWPAYLLCNVCEHSTLMIGNSALTFRRKKKLGSYLH